VARRDAAQWDTLSSDYRRRLTNKGITRADYLAGANLQAARGQRIEAQRTATARVTGGPNPSTVRAWKARARAISDGFSNSEWQTALANAPWEAVRDAVRGREAAHNAWRAAGSPSTRVRKARKLRYDDPIESDSLDWGESWSYYH
jgi:hypothetical protein